MGASPPPLAVTIGEPAGIGPDVILLARARHGDLPPFFVLGDVELLRDRARRLRLDLEVRRRDDGGPASTAGIEVAELSTPMRAEPGTPRPDDAAGVIEAIQRAVDMAITGESSAIVTAPIHKKALYDAGFGHPGHTEFLAELARRHVGAPLRPVMMIAGPQLRTIPVTIHIALRQVPDALTSELIFETGRIAATDLRGRFGIDRPRLAVAGLNPHAGEGGALGTEDEEIVAPAVRRLRAEGIDAFGPLPADTMFHAAARKRYDAAMCMYHDQALIPAKTLAFDEAVNVTLGLPFIRTSPDHGTALDIAGTGKASPASFVAALQMAWEMSGHGVN